MLPVLLVVGVVAGYLYFAPGAAHHETRGTGAWAESAPDRLRLGEDYYLFCRIIELYPQPPGGGAWDRLGDAAPDIAYALRWQDTIIFESPTRDDTLIGLWDGISVDLRKALLEGRLEPSAMLNHAATVNVTEGGTLTIHVWDEDLTRWDLDDAGAVTLDLADLNVGDNVIRLEPSENNAIKRIVLRATATDQPAKNLVEALSAP